MSSFHRYSLPDAALLFPDRIPKQLKAVVHTFSDEFMQLRLYAQLWSLVFSCLAAHENRPLHVLSATRLAW